MKSLIVIKVYNSNSHGPSSATILNWDWSQCCTHTVVFVTMGEYLSNTQQLLGFPNILSTSSWKTDLFQEPLDGVRTLQPEKRKYVQKNVSTQQDKSHRYTAKEWNSATMVYAHRRSRIYIDLPQKKQHGITSNLKLAVTLIHVMTTFMFTHLVTYIMSIPSLSLCQNATNSPQTSWAYRV